MTALALVSLFFNKRSYIKKLTEARDSKWQWQWLYTSLRLAPERQPRQHPTTQFFTGRMPFLPPNQQRQSTEGNKSSILQQSRKWQIGLQASGPRDHFREVT